MKIDAETLKKQVILHLPYVLFLLVFAKLGEAVRLAPGADASQKLLGLSEGFALAFQSMWPGAAMDWLIGFCGAAIMRLAVYLRGKDAKKYRKKECERYEELIRSLGGVDLQLLGMGHNGHIGFNEPGQAFETGTHCVDLQESTIEANKRFFASATDVPRQAYTMGIKTIMQAKKILVVVSGEDKAEIVKKAFFGPVIPGVPASILQMHNDVILVGDEAALSLI